MNIVRECRDSDDHPNSTAIMVMFDVTGSMGQVPLLLQQKLPNLFGMLLRKGFVSDPQILMGAIGDAWCDRGPLQVGQFESDNRIDSDLEKIWLEGGGGGQVKESYELAVFFAANRTSIDCHEKHGRKGYLFIIGDEMSHPLSASQVRDIIGGEVEPTSLEEMFKEVQRKYNVFFLHPANIGYRAEDHAGFWEPLLGERFVKNVDPSDVCEVIAGLIAATEGYDQDDINDSLDAINAPSSTKNSVNAAVSTVLRTSSGSVANVLGGDGLSLTNKGTSGRL